jgi:hypothetical protein
MFVRAVCNLPSTDYFHDLVGGCRIFRIFIFRKCVISWQASKNY